MPNNFENSVAAHYGKGGLIGAIDAGLTKIAANPEMPTIEELAPVDEFHTAGRITTMKALEMIPLKPGMHVLDAGCGIGGTARCLAREHGCRVTGIDLTPEYVEVARILTERMDLSDMCRFEVASVTEIRFADAIFDAAVTFHVAMNVENRPKFYAELARVLRPGATLCAFDVMKGPTPGMRFPVPWAETEEMSFLKTHEETCNLLQEAGFEIVGGENLRDFAIGYFESMLAKAADDPPPLGLHLLTGANTQEKFANVFEVLKTHQTEPAIVVARRQS